MQYKEVWEFIKSRLGPIELDKRHRSRKKKDDEEADTTIDVEGIPCSTFEELCSSMFLQPGEDEDELWYKLHHRKEIEQTLAAMIAVILSTSATGGQLGLRVMGGPGTCKSTLAECLSCNHDLVIAKSKFTGIVSGWNSIRKSQMTANKMNGKCVMVKDADTMMQLPNLSQVESEIRDAMGDGVIRAEYRTGKSFDVYTLFTMIQCGTEELKQMDNALLGARFLDIYIHNRHDIAGSKKTVERAIKSQFRTIMMQLEGGISTSMQSEAKRKEQIVKLAPRCVGFLDHKRQQITEGITGQGFTQKQADRIQALAELTAFLRARIKKDKEGNNKGRVQKELGTRLGEQLVRFAIFLALTFSPGKTAVFTEEMFTILRKLLDDTNDSYPWDIVMQLHTNPEYTGRGASSDELANSIGTAGQTTIYNCLKNMVDLGIVKQIAPGNGKGKGRSHFLYLPTDEITYLCQEAKL